ncbi:porin family outer membrane protein [Salinisphaera sp. PC39]
MRKLALTAATAVLWPFATNAAPDYSYLQADWIADGEAETELVSGDHDYDGWAVEIAVALGDHLFFRSAYENLSVDDFGGARTLSTGLGMHYAIGNPDTGLDLYGLLTHENLETNGDSGDGYGVTAGARWQIMPQWELNPSIGYVDYGDIDSLNGDTSGMRYGIRSVYAVNDLLSVNLGYRMTELDSDGQDIDLKNELRLGLRIDVE